MEDPEDHLDPNRLGSIEAAGAGEARTGYSAAVEGEELVGVAGERCSRVLAVGDDGAAADPAAGDE
jgi:hypothetical protein